MSLLPKFTYLGELDIIEVYEAYDDPCLFACQNASGQIYLVVLIGEDEDYKIWLYTALSQKRFECVRSGRIDLHDGFKLAEDGFSVIVKVPFSEDSNSVIEMIQSRDLAEDILPFAGEYLTLETQTLPAIPRNELQKLASSLWCEVVRFKVDIPGVTRNEAPIKEWGSMLSSLQDVVESIGKELGREKIKKGQLNNEVSRQTRLLATVTSAGSYAIDLVANTNANLFKESLLGESLVVLFNLIEASTNISSNNKTLESTSESEHFSKILNTLGRHFSSKYRKFLRAVANSESDIVFDWGSPHPERGGIVRLSYNNVLNSLYEINKMEIAPPTLLEVTGILVGGNIESKRFEIRDIYDDSKYRGTVSDALLASEVDMTLDFVYSATIEETIEVVRTTGEAKPKYRLIKLERLLITKANDVSD